MKMLSTGLLAILLTSASAFARLGETPDQCQMRYGTSNGSSGGCIRYFKDHFDIAVRFRDGKSIEETFTPNVGADVTENRIAELLAANSDGSAWSRVRNEPAYKRYLRADGGARATLIRGSLTIEAIEDDKLIVPGKAADESVAARPPAKGLPAKDRPAVAAGAPPKNRATPTSETNPDLMRRMGFSEKEIAEAQVKR